MTLQILDLVVHHLQNVLFFSIQEMQLFTAVHQKTNKKNSEIICEKKRKEKKNWKNTQIHSKLSIVQGFQSWIQ